MARKKHGAKMKAPPSEFGAALDAWSQENPRAWDDDERRRAGKAGENDLAQDLKRLKRELSPGPSREVERPKPVISASKAEEMSEAQARRFTARPTERRQLTAQELMAEAFEALGDPHHSPTAKYSGEGYRAALEVEVIDEQAAGVADEAQARYGAIDGVQEGDLEFLDLMASADVTPLDRGVDRLRTARDERRKWFVEEHAEPPSERDLLEPELSGEERELLRRARKQGYVPTLHVRLMRRHEAVAEVARFVQEQWESGTRFVRVITGKGKNSDGPVVLKPAVIEWVSVSPGTRYVKGWAAETDRSGAWGAMILELRRKG